MNKYCSGSTVVAGSCHVSESFRINTKFPVVTEREDTFFSSIQPFPTSPSSSFKLGSLKVTSLITNVCAFRTWELRYVTHNARTARRCMVRNVGRSTLLNNGQK